METLRAASSAPPLGESTLCSWPSSIAPQCRGNTQSSSNLHHRGLIAPRQVTALDRVPGGVAPCVGVHEASPAEHLTDGMPCKLETCRDESLGSLMANRCGDNKLSLSRPFIHLVRDVSKVGLLVTCALPRTQLEHHQSAWSRLRLTTRCWCPQRPRGQTPRGPAWIAKICQRPLCAAQC